MKKGYKKLTLIITLALALSFVLAMPTTVSAASKKPAKVKQYSVTRVDHDSLKISWAKAKYAKKYQVYMATSKNGRYKKIKTTSARSCQKNGLTTGKTYYFKVRAVNGSKKGSYSSKKSSYPRLNTVSGLSATAKPTEVTLTWNSIAGASAYQIASYDEYDDLLWTKIVSTSSRYGYTVDGLEENTNYSFKVRARKYANKKYQYGYYSSLAEVKTPCDHNYEANYNETEPTELLGYTCTKCNETKVHSHSFIVKPNSDNSLEICTSDDNCTFERPHTHSITTYTKSIKDTEGLNTLEYTEELWEKCTVNGCTHDKKHEHVAKDDTWYHDDTNNTHYQLCNCGERVSEGDCNQNAESKSMCVRILDKYCCNKVMDDGTKCGSVFLYLDNDYADRTRPCTEEEIAQLTDNGTKHFFDMKELYGINHGHGNYDNSVTEKVYLAPYTVHSCSVCGHVADSELKEWDWENIKAYRLRSIQIDGYKPEDSDSRRTNANGYVIVTDWTDIMEDKYGDAWVQDWNNMSAKEYILSTKYKEYGPAIYKNWTNDSSTWH